MLKSLLQPLGSAGGRGELQWGLRLGAPPREKALTLRQEWHPGTPPHATEPKVPAPALLPLLQFLRGSPTLRTGPHPSSEAPPPRQVPHPTRATVPCSPSLAKGRHFFLEDPTQGLSFRVYEVGA